MEKKRVVEAWAGVVRCLGVHAPKLYLHQGASLSQIADLEQILGLTLPEDYKAWLQLHDGQSSRPVEDENLATATESIVDDIDDEEPVFSRPQPPVNWLPTLGQMLPSAVVAERWQDEQKCDPVTNLFEDEDEELDSWFLDSDRIKCVVIHPRRIPIASSFGDG
jgi:cell wall assembly regulator SMI1